MDIDHLDITNDFKDYLRDFDAPPTGFPVAQEDISSLEGRFHEDLIGYFRGFGRSTLRDGLLQTCLPYDMRSILALVFKADDDFNHNDYSCFAYTAFGKLYGWHMRYGVVSIDLVSGEVTARGLKKFNDGEDISGQQHQYKGPFDETLEDLNNVYDEDGDKIFDRCVAKYGPVGIGECFGFFPAIALGGATNVENVRKVRALEHFTLLAQMQSFKWVHIETDFDAGRLEKSIIREVG